MAWSDAARAAAREARKAHANMRKMDRTPGGAMFARGGQTLTAARNTNGIATPKARLAIAKEMRAARAGTSYHGASTVAAKAVASTSARNAYRKMLKGGK